MSSLEIRQKFLDFFRQKEHQIISSVPVVVQGDATLMFVNAGMVPFKKYFLGQEPAPHPRIANTQKCLRVSGKHNDLEEVGVDGYHHTMFEMLGNWSFGDYFKKDAIAWSWELITEVYGISAEDIYVTVFEGSESDGTPFDIEAYELWREILPEDRIIKGDKKDNFWEMGNVGPCGPCSEIHLDMRPHSDRAVPGKNLVNKDHPEVIEIWNLVFMEFNRLMDGTLTPLSQKHIDTGMGLERLCRAIQGKASNYDTDLFQPLIHTLSEMAGVSYSGTDAPADVAFRAVVDHFRAVGHVLSDGQYFSNTGAGYVARRLLRRAVRYGYSYLNLSEPFFYKLLPVWQGLSESAFPEVHKVLSSEIITEEETFYRTLSKGMGRLNSLLGVADRSDKLSGTDVFELYDTYGFPVDMTALILRERGKSYDTVAFEVALREQKERSRKAIKGGRNRWFGKSEVSEHPLDSQGLQFFQDGSQEFTGYDHSSHEWSGFEDTLREDQNFVAQGSNDRQRTILAFRKTPFYGASGGQIGDRGKVYLRKVPLDSKIPKEASWQVFDVSDTQKERDVIVHVLSEGLTSNFSNLTGEGERPHRLDYKLVVDDVFRREVSRHHTATHLLHFALGEILGSHVAQKGSRVAHTGLRFDFSHPSKLKPEEIKAVSLKVNEMIRAALPLEETRYMPYDEAVKEGAKALFGEKYGDKVRAVRFGKSMELCGGTHAQNTSELGLFHILSESGVASGVRRIEAVVSEEAHLFFQRQSEEVATVKSKLKAKELSKGIDKLIGSERDLSRRVKKLEAAYITVFEKDLWESRSLLPGGVHLVCDATDRMDFKNIKDVAFQLIENPKTVVLIRSMVSSKVMLTLGVSHDLIEDKGMKASHIIRVLASDINGSGGGQDRMATAGGTRPEGWEDALARLKKILLA